MKKVIRRSLAVILTAILAVAGVALAPAAIAATGKVTGKVTWSGPTPGSKYVDLYEWDEQRQSWEYSGFYKAVDDSGVYTIEDVAPGTYAATVDASNYSDVWFGGSVLWPATYAAAVTFQVKDGQVTSGINLHLGDYWPEVTANLTNFTPSLTATVDFYNLTTARRYSDSGLATASGTWTTTRHLPPGQYWVLASSIASPDTSETNRPFAQMSNLTIGSTAKTIGLTGVNAQKRLYSVWPSISGSTQVGQTIEAHVATEYAGTTPVLSPTVKYFWTDGTRIISTTSKAAIPASVLGTSYPAIAVVVEAPGQVTRIGYGDITEFSLLAQPGSPPFPSTIPGIKGKARVGVTLKARTGTWSPAPASFALQWLRDGKAISGATQASYRLVAADAGKRISVRVSGLRPGHVSSMITTAPTAKVAKAKTKVSIKVAKKTLKKGKKAKVTVRVKAVGATPTGRVTVKFGAKKVKAKLKKGRAVVRSRKLKSGGSLKITAKYVGTKAFAKSKKTVNVKIR